MPRDREPLWEPMTRDEQWVVLRALMLASYLEADESAANQAGRVLDGLLQPGRRLGVTCDPV